MTTPKKDSGRAPPRAEIEDAIQRLVQKDLSAIQETKIERTNRQVPGTLGQHGVRNQALKDSRERVLSCSHALANSQHGDANGRNKRQGALRLYPKAMRHWVNGLRHIRGNVCITRTFMDLSAFTTYYVLTLSRTLTGMPRPVAK